MLKSRKTGKKNEMRWSTFAGSDVGFLSDATCHTITVARSDDGPIDGSLIVVLGLGYGGLMIPGVEDDLTYLFTMPEPIANAVSFCL